MIDVNNTNSFLHPKIVGQSIEDSAHFRATNDNFANRKATSNNEYMAKDDDYEYCPNCSRKFFVGRLALHLKSCKEGKPLKPVKTKGQDGKAGSLTDGNNEFAGGDNESKTPELDRKKNHSNNYGNTRQSSLQERSEELVNRYLQSALMDDKQTTQESYYKKSNLYEDNQKFKEVTFQQRPEYDNEEEEAENREERQDQDQEQEQEQEYGQGEEVDQGDRVPCEVCGRKFAADRVEKHEMACKKSSKKRKVFDTSKQRALPEQAQIKTVSKNDPAKNKKPTGSAVKEAQNNTEEQPLKKVPAWKVEHENFIKNIKFNRKVKAMEANGEDTSNLVAPTIVNENYVQCPHCTRKFAPATADRHIPKCKNTFNRPKPPKNLNLDKMEEMQRVDRAKVNYILKKGVSHKVSPSEGDLRKFQGSTNDISATENEKNLSHRSPQSAISNRAASQHEDKTPKGSAQKPPVNVKTGSKLLLRKQNSTDITIKRASTSEQKYDHEDVSPTGLVSHEIKLEKKGSYRAASPGEKRVFIEAMPKKEDLLQNYQSIYNRANTSATQECPHCARKFNPQAAQRHIPICQDLKTRPLKKVIDRTNSKEIIEKTDMKQTLLGTKFGFKKQGDNDESVQNKTSAAGGFFGKQNSRNGERPPLPGKKPAHGLLETCEPIMEKTAMGKPKLGMTSGSGSASAFCTSCGSKNVKTHKFCGYCGSKK